MLQKVMAERRDYHKRLFDDKIFSINHLGVASNADSSNKLSKKIAFEVLNLLSDVIKESEKLPAQSLGVQFEKRTAEFIKNTFPLLTIYLKNSLTVNVYGNYDHFIIKADDVIIKNHEYCGGINKREKTSARNDSEGTGRCSWHA